MSGYATVLMVMAATFAVFYISVYVHDFVSDWMWKRELERRKKWFADFDKRAEEDDL